MEKDGDYGGCVIPDGLIYRVYRRNERNVGTGLRKDLPVVNWVLYPPSS